MAGRERERNRRGSTPAVGAAWDRAERAEVAGDGRAAAGAYVAVLGLRPESAEAWNNLGAALESLRLLDEASRCFERASVLAPGLGPIRANLGNILCRRGRWREAETALTAATEHSPEDTRAWLDLGHCRRMLGDSAGAEQALRRAVALSPQDAIAWFNLGNAMADQGRPADAVAAFRRATGLQDDDHEAWNNLGVALYEAGRNVEAVDCFERAIARGPSFAPAWNNLGVAIEALDDLHRAVTAYRRAVDLSGDRSEYHLNLASALCRLERRTDAARHLDAALRIQPELRTVAGALPELEWLSLPG